MLFGNGIAAVISNICFGLYDKFHNRMKLYEVFLIRSGNLLNMHSNFIEVLAFTIILNFVILFFQTNGEGIRNILQHQTLVLSARKRTH